MRRSWFRPLRKNLGKKNCELADADIELIVDTTKISYGGYRFPPEIIQHAIWLYYRFTLSFRDVEDLLAERGIIVSYETVRRWANHFGPTVAADLRKRRSKPRATRHLDEGAPRRREGGAKGIVTAIWACGLAGGSLAKGMAKISYKGYRFPPEIIQQAIWLYPRFTLSFRDDVQAARRRSRSLRAVTP
jgi:transposase-like protein